MIFHVQRMKLHILIKRKTGVGTNQNPSVQSRFQLCWLSTRQTSIPSHFYMFVLLDTYAKLQGDEIGNMFLKADIPF